MSEEMTDLEIARLCAEAMGLKFEVNPNGGIWIPAWPNAVSAIKDYDPLHDDAQAHALVRAFNILLMPGIRTPKGRGPWHAEIKSPDWESYSTDLNRAICECVAKMQAAK